MRLHKAIILTLVIAFAGWATIDLLSAMRSLDTGYITRLEVFGYQVGRADVSHSGSKELWLSVGDQIYRVPGGKIVQIPIRRGQRIDVSARVCGALIPLGEWTVR